MEQKKQLTQQKVLALTNKQKKEITRKNLIRVLEELPKLANQMPQIKRNFDMKYYKVYNNLKKEDLNKCRTAGCLLGNAARLFKDEFTDDLFGEFNEFDYGLFGRKFFPYLYGYLDCVTLKWEYLFQIDWAGTKFKNLNSALQRIQNLLENDLECNKFSFRTNKIIN